MHESNRRTPFAGETGEAPSLVRLRRFRIRDRPTVVSLTFDDGRANQSFAADLLAEAGLKATFYVCSGQIDSPGFLSWSELRALIRSGHEVGGHTVDHVDLTSVAPSAARQQIMLDRQELLAQGFDAVSFAYPYGARNGEVQDLVRRAGYRSARRAWGLLRPGAAGDYGSDFSPCESIPPANRLQIRTVDCVESTTTLADLQLAVIRADEGGGGWVPLVFHDIEEGNGRYATRPDTLGELAAWLVERGTSVRTVDEVVAGRSYR